MVEGAGTNPSFEGCTFRSNQAPSPHTGGGGAYIWDRASPRFTNTTFEANVVQGSGGGVYVSGSGTNPSFEGCTFRSNQAPHPTYGGGGAFIQNRATEFQKCLNPDACQNRTLAQACTKPYRGHLCSMCLQGHGINDDFQCVKCGSHGAEIAVLCAVVASALLISGGLVAYTIYSAEKAGDSYKSGKNKPIYVALTIISMLQSMAFFKGFDYSWPSSIRGMFDTSQTASGGGLGLVNMQCVASGVFGGSSYIYTEALLLMLLGPLCLAVFVTALLILQWVRSGNLQRRIYICVVYVVFLFQPIVIKGILKVMTCSRVGGTFFVFYEMDIECGSSSHVSWLVVVLIGFFMYVILLPGLNFWAQYKDRELIQAEDEEKIRLYGFQVKAFVPDCYYWQACIMSRKVAQTALITLSKPMGIVIQSQLALLVSMVALVFQVRCQP